MVVAVAGGGTLVAVVVGTAVGGAGVIVGGGGVSVGGGVATTAVGAVSVAIWFNSAARVYVGATLMVDAPN